MLTFLRKIRKSLIEPASDGSRPRPNESSLSERTSVQAGGRARKYLLYAIGEILLVVAGILLALQVNNWNEVRKNRIKEYELLLVLKEEVATNIDQLSEAISYTIRSKEGARQIVKIYQGDYTEYGASHLDSLLGQVQWAWTYDPVMGVPISIRTSGQINTISNTELRLFVASFEEMVRDVKEEGYLMRKMIVEQYMPMIGKYVSSNNRSYFLGNGYAVVEKSVFDSDYSALFADRQVEDLITYMHVWRNDQLREESAFLEILKDVLEIVNRELERWK